ncbi:cell division protein DrpB [Buttiauxella selenatireducens]|uniref:Cell division protein DrpB n=1 Tax=Buttiauxella selenatireducens TaxID=3073902 RepID=A0ABY9S4G8_9ENTR|nr:cell division protein DrpB [Buttiauxella sp. R73]WMY72393.1 cell division protein DrpB [Buttiauxella sp. R73]
MSNTDPKKKKRTPIGKFMLWLFYLFCIYAVFCLFKAGVAFSHIHAATGQELGVRAGEFAGTLIILIYLGFLGGITGLLAWLTRAK